MATTKGFPYPQPSDDPNVPGDIQALAEAVDAELDGYLLETDAATTYRTTADSYTKAQVDTAVAGVITGSYAKVFIGTAYGTPAVGGKLTVTHGAGFTPAWVIATALDSDTAIQGHKGLVCNVLTDGIRATEFDVRVYRNDDATAWDSAIRIMYVCVAA